MVTTGQCLCGAVKYRAEDVDPNAQTCHCNMCRRWSGGPVLATGAGAVSFEGEQHITRYQSSAWAERGFCSQCGTNLFYHLKANDHYVLWVGAFDDPEPFELSGEIFFDEKPSGYAFAGDHPRLTGAEFMASLQQDP